MRIIPFLLLVFPFFLAAQDLSEDVLAAARKGDAAAVKALLDKGAPIEAKTPYGVTPLFFAARNGHTEVVRLLVERGAQVNVTDTFYKSTALGWAAGSGHADVVRLLLEKGATGADQALTSAVAAGHASTVQAILDKGGLKPPQLSSALALATNRGKADIAEMLKKAGAVLPPKPNFQVDEATLKSYEGTYTSDMGFDVKVSAKDGKLMLEPPGSPPLELGAVDKVTFRLLVADTVSLTFKVEDGKVTGMTVKQPNNTMELKKAEKKP